MYSSYVNAEKMGGKGARLGLVFTKGAMSGYAIENRGKPEKWGYFSSNSRGTILFDIAPFELEPGRKHTVQWYLFWNKGWNDF